MGWSGAIAGETNLHRLLQPARQLATLTGYPAIQIPLYGRPVEKGAIALGATQRRIAKSDVESPAPDNCRMKAV